MVFGLFKKSPLLDESSIDWLYDGYAWSLKQFGSEYFYQKTILVEPTDSHFPGKANDPQSMAELILDKVQQYAGVSAWPCRLLDHKQVSLDINQLPGLPEVLDTNRDNPNDSNALVLLYEPMQVRKPEVMIANFSHLIAHHMGYLASEKPPCDDDQWFHMAELVAIFMGFGLMLANTASPYRGGGCARCVSPLLERTGHLSEDEVAYALAIFSVLKSIDDKTVIKHLKKSLIPLYKRAIGEIKSNETRLKTLKVIHSNPSCRYVE